MKNIDRSSPNVPEVTVLMSVYNGERYLREAIESILRQTFTGFEFLIINDGSTDASREIIASYSDPRINLVNNHENIGLTKSLNRGLELSTGELIARMDADDIALPRRLEEQTSYLDAHPEVVLLGTQTEYIDEKGRVQVAPEWSKALTSQGIYFQIMIDSAFVHTSVMFRRSVIWDKLCGYDERFKTSQDADLWSRVTGQYKTQNLPVALVRSRLRRGSISASGYLSLKDSHLWQQAAKQGTALMTANITRCLGTHALSEPWVEDYQKLYFGIHPASQKQAVRLIAGMKHLLLQVRNTNATCPAKKEFSIVVASKFLLIARYLLPKYPIVSIRAFWNGLMIDRTHALKVILSKVKTRVWTNVTLN